MITLINTDSTTIIDGLTIEEGEAFAFASEGQDKRHGSAIYHIQTVMNLKSEFKVKNCRFRNHKAYEETILNLEGGGTIYNEALSGDIFVEIENCTFENIEGNYKILYNKTNTENDSISVFFKDCSMQNSMGDGDIIKSKSDNGKIKLNFENTTFKNFEFCDEFIFCEGDSTLFDISFSDCLIDSIGYGNTFFKDFILNEGVNSDYKINFYKNTYSNNRRTYCFSIEDDSLTKLTLSADSCHFKGNTSVFKPDHIKEANMVITDCSFTDTMASQIRVYGIYQKSDINLEGCIFENGNLTHAIAFNSPFSSFSTLNQSLKINNCQFKNNELRQAVNSSGIISIVANASTNVEINSTIFSNIEMNNSNNSFIRGSLGIAITLMNADAEERGNINIDNCTFTDNMSSAAIQAATISVNQPFSGLAENMVDLNINNCIFSGNSTEDNGSIYLKNINAEVNNCIFYSNATAEGGSIIGISKEEEIEETNAIFTNCTFADTASTTIHNEASNIFFRNCIFSSDSILVSVDTLFPVVNEFDYCVFAQDDCPTESEFCNNSIFDVNIDFNNPEEEDYSLSNCSPAVDFGSNVYVEAAEILLDLNGQERLQDAAPDAGAYEVPAFTAEIILIAPDTCDSIPDGAVEINAYSFCPPLTYSWGETISNEAVSLPFGDYPLTISDANNRQVVLNISIPDTLGFQLSSEIMMPQCETSMPGNILNSIVAESTSTYNFLWNDELTEQNRADILAGEYSLTVTNAVGCTDSTTFEIISEGSINVELETVNLTCHDSADGEISVFPTGGFNELNYNWTDGNLEQTRINLEGGIYEVTVSDEYGCSGEIMTELVTPTEIELQSFVLNASTSTSNDGSVEIEAINGGYPPYSLLWNTGIEDSLIENISFGEYSLTVTDSVGCQSTFEFYVDFNSSSTFVKDSKLDIFPNPVLRGGRIQIFDRAVENCQLEWRDIQGRKLGSGRISTNSNFILAPRVSGVYILSVQVENGVIHFTKIVVN